MDYVALRNRMIDCQIRTTDVTSHSVLNALLAVAREDFVDDRHKTVAYIDNDMEIAPGRFMMAPSPLAKMLQLAEIASTDRVLEIGTGTGYATAVLAHLGGNVVSVESDAALVAVAKANLAGFDNITIVSGPLAQGAASNAPYDVIFINGSVDDVPAALFDQMMEGGRLVAVIGEGQSCSAHLFVRERGTISERFAFNASVRRLPGFQKAAEFVF